MPGIISTSPKISINLSTTSIKSEVSDDLTLHILRGASSIGVSDNYIGLGAAQNTADPTRLRYFSEDRIAVEPGTTITIVNDDVVSHNVISGKENNDRYVQFTPDGRISTGDIAPGESANITFDEMGFYRLYDPDYQWMKIVAYVFPNTDSLILGQGQNLGN